MLSNYLKIALRNALKHKGYAFINISGLALGMACCLVILLYVQDELSYDRFHAQADQIYRVGLHRQFPNRQVDFATTPAPLSTVLVNDYPDVRDATRLWRPNGSVAVRHEDQTFTEDRLLFADSNFFDVFSIPLLQGTPQQALAQPNAVILTATTARTYFGTANAVGQRLTLGSFGEFTVSAVSEDVPPHSHVHFDFLAAFSTLNLSTSLSWATYPVYTYILLGDGQSPQVLQDKLPETLRTYVAPQVEQILGISFDEYLASGNAYEFIPQALTDIHLHSHLVNELEPNSDIAYVYLFSAIALFILLLACINFMNLSTARSTKRAKEVGIRKALGSQRTQLVGQFLIESVVLSVLALGAALGLVKLLLPVFNAIAGIQLSVAYLALPWFLPATLGFSVFVGLLAGLYPALFLSFFRPIAVLKGGKLPRKQGGATFRNGLVVFQFMVSIILMIGTAMVYNQMDFMLNTKLGFDKEQVVVIARGEALGSQGETFKQTLLQHPDILNATLSTVIPGRSFTNLTVEVDEAPTTERLLLTALFADHDFVPTYKMEVVAGRSFSEDFATDDSLSVVLNETAARAIGWEDPLGQRLNWLGSQSFTVIGVVKDFHFESLRQEIAPLALFGPTGSFANASRLVSVRLRPDDVPQTLAFLERTWHAFAPDQPFSYSFLNEDLTALYEAERVTADLLGAFASLAILIACLGLFGLASFLTEQRTKEIGVRKVLGASVANILVLLSKEFTKLVTVACVIALPIAYFVMDDWLQSFAYRVDISWRIFLMAGLAALGIALLTVSYQTIKAARANPVDALRYE